MSYDKKFRSGMWLFFLAVTGIRYFFRETYGGSLIEVSWVIVAGMGYIGGYRIAKLDIGYKLQECPRCKLYGRVSDTFRPASG
jgi:hypothetical protein